MAVWTDVLEDFEKAKRQRNHCAQIKATKKRSGTTRPEYCALAEPYSGIRITKRDIDYIRALLEYGNHDAASMALGVTKETVGYVVNKLRILFNFRTKEEVISVLPKILEATNCNSENDLNSEQK